MHARSSPVWSSQTSFRLTAVLTAALLLLGLAVFPASASDPNSLPGSNFETDDDANLKVDHPGKIDWNTVDQIRQPDAPPGKDDDSYSGGVKEDTECPDETTGSIPPNKSDLVEFGVYEEPGSPGFLHLYWTRVQEPSGTTLMDFEFNQESPDSGACPQGPNVQRTVGDILIEYSIDQGGAQANVTLREWSGSAWGEPTDISDAVGTINQTAIPAAESELGALSARTFGEASIDLNVLFDEGSCDSFGSAMLKSRSSDSFTSQLKDFIAPVPIALTNCGKVIIRKQTVPDEDPNTTEFGYTKAFSTDPATASTFTLTDDGVATFDNVLFGSGYTVVEDVLPSGWELVDVDCSASTGVTPSIVGATVTFDIDADTDVLDCTYTNQAKASLTVTKITDDGAGSFDFTSASLDPAAFTLTTTEPGAAGSDSRTFADLAPGAYDVAETVPAGWNLVSATCDNGDDPSAITLSAGDDVECTFHDARERGAIEITKTRKHAADGPGDHGHAGVEFTVTGGDLAPEGIVVTTGADGTACLDDLLVSTFAGDYTVTESVPAGYAADGDTAKTVTVTTESTCGDGDEAAVSFSNTPLTDVTVSVDSQVDGGTASTITCTDADGNVVDGSTGANGDGTVTVEDLLPTDPTVTLTCEIVVDP